MSAPTVSAASHPLDPLFELFGELDVNLGWAFGYFAALQSGPTVLPSTEWLKPFLESEQYASLKDQAAAVRLLVTAYEAIGQQMATAPETIVPPMDGPEGAQDVEDFCSGYVDGATIHTQWLEDEEANVLLFVFAAVAREIDEDEIRAADDQPIEDLEAWRTLQREKVPEHVGALYRKWRGKARPATAAKVGRNDPCACGSGKKRKKCCG